MLCSPNIECRSTLLLFAFEGQPSAHKALGCGILGTTETAGATKCLGDDAGKAKAGEDSMSDMFRITSAEAVLPGVLKLAWNDGYEGIVDLRGIIADGEAFELIRDPENFKKVRVASYGHSIYWGEEDNEEVDFGCDRLREMAEEQAALLARAG
jgi:hypothetical protein